MRAYRCYFLNLHSNIERVEIIEVETDAVRPRRFAPVLGRQTTANSKSTPP